MYGQIRERNKDTVNRCYCYLPRFLSSGWRDFHLLAKNFQQELLLHDYGVAGHLLNNEDELSISAFTSLPDANDIERGREALASIGYDETTSMRFLPAVQTYRNQTVLSIFAAVGFPVWGNLLIAVSLSSPPAQGFQ